MNIEAIQAQQERMNREGQTPPDGNYVAFATNLIKVSEKETGRSLIMTFRVAKKIEANGDVADVSGYDLVSTYQKFTGTDETPWGSRDNAASAVAFFTRLGVNAYGIKAILDLASSVEILDRAAIILSNSVPITDENGNEVTFKGTEHPVLLSVKNKGDRAFGQTKSLPKAVLAKL